MKTRTEKLKIFDPKKYAVCHGTDIGPCQQYYAAPPLLADFKKKYPGGGEWLCPDCDSYYAKILNDY